MKYWVVNNKIDNVKKYVLPPTGCIFLESNYIICRATVLVEPIVTSKSQNALVLEEPLMCIALR